jgi:ATP-dependent Clp protease ATP-binding subunit ClpA
VVDKFVMQLEAQLGDRGVTIALNDAARQWLARKGYDKQFGARPLGRIIQEHIKKPLAEELLFGELQKGGIVEVGLTDDKLTFAFKPDPNPKRRDPEEEEGDDGGEGEGGEKEPVLAG